MSAGGPGVSLRSLYTLAGAAWGVVLGAPAATMVSGYLLAAAWLFLFGDDPWPAHSWLVLLPGPIVGIAILLGATALGRWFGSRAELLEAGPERGAMRQRAMVLLGLAVLVGLLEVAAVFALERGQRQERAEAAALDENFTRLVETRHAVASVRAQSTAWDDDRAAELTMAISLAGSRAGDYRISWELTETLHDTPLLVGERRLTLIAGDTVIYVPIDIRMIRDRYRSEVLSGRGGVLVETEWPFKARLRPLLSRAEAEELSRSERQNLRLGYSALLSEGEAPVPVHFRID